MELNELTEKIKELQEENEKLKELIPKEDAEEKTVKEFLDKYPIAKDFIDELCGCFEEDETLDGDDGLKCALIKVLTENYKTPESYACDGDFLEKYVYGNENVKKRIIEEYLANVKSSPAVSYKKGALPCTEREKPESVRDAGELARAFFKKSKK